MDLYELLDRNTYRVGEPEDEATLLNTAGVAEEGGRVDVVVSAFRRLLKAVQEEIIKHATDDTDIIWGHRKAGDDCRQEVEMSLRRGFQHVVVLIDQTPETLGVTGDMT